MEGNIKHPNCTKFWTKSFATGGTGVDDEHKYTVNVSAVG